MILTVPRCRPAIKTQLAELFGGVPVTRLVSTQSREGPENVNDTFPAVRGVAAASDMPSAFIR